MISSIGFLEKNFSLEKLERYEADESIKDKFPIFKNLDKYESDSSDIEDEKILLGDTTVFFTYNNDDYSSLVFYVFNNEYFYPHHDCPVYNTAFDSCEILIKDKTYLAIATAAYDVEVYDACLKNIIYPQFSLVKHTNSVTSVKTSDSNLYSGSLDRSVVKWDLEKLVPCEVSNIPIEVSKMQVFSDGIVAAQKDLYLIQAGDTKKIDNASEINCLLVDEGKIYFSDSIGKFSCFDTRYLEKPVFSKLLYKEPVSCFDIASNTLVANFCDGNTKVFDKQTLEEKKAFKTGSSVSCLKICQYYQNVCFYGSNSDAPNYFYI